MKAKPDNRKLLIGILLVVAAIFIGYVSFTFYKSMKNGLVSTYVNQKTAQISGQEYILAKSRVTNEKAIFEGYSAEKYFKNGKVLCGVFYFNGNFEAEKHVCNTSLFQILFVGH